MTVHIYAHDVFLGDAVGNHCLGLKREFESAGLQCELYAERHDSRANDRSQLLQKARPNDFLIVSHSIFDPYLEEAASVVVPKVCYFHGITPPELIIAFDPVTAGLCEKGLKQLAALRRFDRVLVNSRATASQLERYSGIRDVTVVPPVVSSMRVFRSKAVRPQPWGYPVNILILGRVVAHKNIEEAVTLVNHLRNRGVKAELNVVGVAENNDYTAYIKRTVDDLNLRRSVHFHGKVAEDKLLKVLEETDILLTTSRHEGFCVPVLEALSQGKVCMVKNGTAAHEMLGSEGAGLVFDEASEAASLIHECYANPEQVQLMQANALKRARGVLSHVSSDCLVRAFGISLAPKA